MRTMLAVLFCLRKPKNYESGSAPIYLRITVDGKRTEISIGRKCNPDRWDIDTGRATGNKEDARSLNAFMSSIEHQLYEIHRQMTAADETVTVETIKSRYTGKLERARTLVAIFEDHNEKMKALIGHEFEKSTWQRYETALMHTKDFMQWQYNITDIPVSKINFAFLNDFEYYLRTVRKCANNSAIKYIKNLGKIVRICLGNGWLTIDPYLNYKPRTQKVYRQVLDTKELDRLTKKKIPNARLRTVRDIFVFSCYTGLAYVDARKLKRSELVKGIDNKTWIYTQRQKTDTLSRIPVLPVAAGIIRTYDKHPQCIAENLLLPVMSNQKMNAYLKELAGICDIEKELTFHIARHTFATTVTLNNGVPIETVSKMMGHTSIKTTQIYAKVLDHKISEDMSQLEAKLLPKKRVAKTA
ncbi:site-specific integrase [Mucilaginibacter conchicola]|uniref:Site-specific integrase n=3 Tax=Mucilaginibacter TaxID=423349 RepID=A0A372NTW2_9SPHI|nr:MULTISPECIES: site-specific integrase [Mucilaginibacter]MBS7565659.1 site-specific integrase [Mucilaginibacter sp. Bleaf8]RFZ92675.1 site-specific integrase [Mucilaginibacter conchicola]